MGFFGRLWDRLAGAAKLWWAGHFTGFSRREAWGYAIWLSFAAFILVPELLAAFWKDHWPFPTISATVAALEYDRPWIGLVVTGVIVGCAYSSFRFPTTRTGVLRRRAWSRELSGETLRGDDALPYRTPGGGRLTRSTNPVREISAGAYFFSSIAVILIATGVAIAATGGLDEYYVGRTFWGLSAFLLAVLPSGLAWWSKRWAIDVPFPTMFSTVRSFERRLRPVALLVIAGLVILLLHLVLYPWPSNIPDFSRTHRIYECNPLDAANHPLTPAQKEECKRIEEAEVRPEPDAP